MCNSQIIQHSFVTFQMQDGGPQTAQSQTVTLQDQIEEKQKKYEDLEETLERCKEKINKENAKKVF